MKFLVAGISVEHCGNERERIEYELQMRGAKQAHASNRSRMLRKRNRREAADVTISIPFARCLEVVNTSLRAAVREQCMFRDNWLRDGPMRYSAGFVEDPEISVEYDRDRILASVTAIVKGHCKVFHELDLMIARVEVFKNEGAIEKPCTARGRTTPP